METIHAFDVYYYKTGNKKVAFYHQIWKFAHFHRKITDLGKFYGKITSFFTFKSFFDPGRSTRVCVVQLFDFYAKNEKNKALFSM